MVSLILAAVLASNATGKALVRQQQGTIVPQSAKIKPVITEDAGVVAHVWFNGTGIQDTKGNAWPMNGTVPQVARVPPRPSGSGPFMDAAWYSSATASDAFDVTTFTACVVFAGPSSFTRFNAFVQAGDNSSKGWNVFLNQTTPTAGFYSFPSSSLSTSNAAVASAVNVACWGHGAGTSHVKLNLGSDSTSSRTITSDTGTASRIGNTAAANQYFGATIFEVYMTTTAPTDALFTSIMNEVKAKLGITAW